MKESRRQIAASKSAVKAKYGLLTRDHLLFGHKPELFGAGTQAHWEDGKGTGDLLLRASDLPQRPPHEAVRLRATSAPPAMWERRVCGSDSWEQQSGR